MSTNSWRRWDTTLESGKLRLLIGWWTTILISDCLIINSTNLWLVDQDHWGFPGQNQGDQVHRLQRHGGQGSVSFQNVFKCFSNCHKLVLSQWWVLSHIWGSFYQWQWKRYFLNNNYSSLILWVSLWSCQTTIILSNIQTFCVEQSGDAGSWYVENYLIVHMIEEHWRWFILRLLPGMLR